MISSLRLAARRCGEGFARRLFHEHDAPVVEMPAEHVHDADLDQVDAPGKVRR